jgi:isoleucyl-tRNA synthetase
VTDRIDLKVQDHAAIRNSLLNNKEYICAEILAASLVLVDRIDTPGAVEVEVDDQILTSILIRKR